MERSKFLICESKVTRSIYLIRKIELHFKVTEILSSSYGKSLLVATHNEIKSIDMNGLVMETYFTKNVDKIIDFALDFNLIYIIRENGLLEV